SLRGCRLNPIRARPYSARCELGRNECALVCIQGRANTSVTTGGISMSNAVAVTDQTFETEVLKSPVPVLVDFWAAWCGPCRAIAPAIDQIASEYEGKLKVVKLDVDQFSELSVRYNVQGIP